MTLYDIIIIGAGASGLIAARELTKHGKKVCILEARNRVGGRIHTAQLNGFTRPIELGAEFIHGESPITMSLLKEAGSNYHEDTGKVYEVQNNELIKNQDFIEGMKQLQSKAKELKHDMPIDEFLARHFNEPKYQNLRESVVRMAEGFDIADTSRASTKKLVEEWAGGGVEESYHPDSGYGVMIDFLVEVNKALGCDIILDTIVKEVIWKQNEATVITSDNKHYTAQQVIITVPLGVLLAEEKDIAYIRFTPDIKDKHQAIKKLGYGGVIKFNLQFKEAFWENKHDGIRRMSKLGFLLNDHEVRAWWTQLPNETPMLTGWIGGPPADELKFKSQHELLSIALDTLAYIFASTKSFLESQLVATQITNWCTDPFSLGAYSYQTVETESAKNILVKPVESTLFFAGEAVSIGEAIGTVEAALESGLLAAFTLLKSADTSA